MRTLFLGTLLVLAISGPTRADDPKLPALEALGQVTGDRPLEAQLKHLIAQPAATKKLIAEALDQLEKKQPLNYTAAFLLAHAAAKLKDVKASEVFYRASMAEATKLQSRAKVLATYGGLIDLLYNNKKYAESARVCQELLDLKADDGKPRHYLAEFEDPVKGRYFDEVENYDPYRSLRPGVHRLRIQAVSKQGKYELALKLADSLVRNDDQWENRELKGWVLRDAGRFAEAAKVYEDVIERIAEDQTLTQKGKDLYANTYRYLLSGVYVEAGNINRAAEQLKTLIEKQPDQPAYYNDLGYIWADHDQNLTESERLIRKALELDRAQQLKKNPKLKTEEVKGNGAYLDSLGWVLFKQKKYKEAKVELLKAVADKDAQHLEIYDHLGDVLMALGERDAALKAWRRGLELVGDSRREQERKTIVEKKVEKVK